MNKAKFLVTGAILCIFGIMGCTNDVDEVGALPSKQAIMTVQADATVPETRADYTDDNTKMNFSWRSGDALSVVVMDGTNKNNNCQLSTKDEGKNAVFSGNVAAFEGSKNIYAFYPANAKTPYVVTGGDESKTATAALTLPDPQLYTVGGAINNSFMVGIGNTTADGTNITAEASFKQVMCIIKLNIIKALGKVKNVKLKCDEELFPTMATVKLSDASVLNTSTLKNELSMNVTDNTTETDKSISFAMFPTADLKGKEITIEITFNDGSDDIVKSITKTGIDFKRNMHYIMSFNGSLSTDDYIEVNGIKVAVGNLVSDGANGAKIGESNVNDLFFQFGSLVGWSTKGATPTILAKPYNLKTYNEGWGALGKIWSSSTAVVPSPGDTGFSETDGVGDPCSYYLGKPWRLPTIFEYQAMFNKKSEYNSSNGWVAKGNFALNSNSYIIHTSGLKILCGLTYRLESGTLENNPGGNNLYWSGTPATGNSTGVGFSMDFTGVGTQNPMALRIMGYPVRCIQ